MSRSARSRTRLAAGAAAVCLAGGLLTVVGSPAAADHPPTAPPKDPVAIGSGGAVSSVDPNATQIGIDVLRSGGNATDAAVATAAALGVTEPYSAGIGGGGFFVHYDADSGEVETVDGRETAPMAMPSDAFIDPATGQPYAPFFPNLVTSGVSVGVPGTASTWETALDNWGSMSLRKALKPATKLADKGFVVDETFHQQTNDNAERFAAIESTADLYLPDGAAPPVGSVFRNPDLADTYELLGRHGPDAILEGPIAAEVVDAVQDPPTTGESDLPVPPGFMELSDLADYEVREPDPTRSDYRGLDIYGMAPPSSGGSTVGEALNILETTELSPTNLADALHRYLEASALAFADRGAFLGDSDFVDVPLDELLSDGFAAERACQIDPDAAAMKPLAVGEPDGDYETTCEEAAPGADRPDSEGLSTTHLTAVDRWGNVVAYTLTIEQTGGSGIVVPGRGFILNNELTDFSTVFNEADPNRIQPGKRPRSSMSPTIVLKDDEPWLALGSPGGSTIITTVLQMLVNRVDLEMSLPDALAAPRASQRNTVNVSAEQEFVDAYGSLLAPLGHTFASPAEIGAATAIEMLPEGRLLAAAEPVRRGGGDAGVVRPGRDD
ncbi:MAG: gamma-glutamyltransferase [Propionibacteriales bacterium]|nr:gamma-glutamyltransferase [Propionibacteriales bacterium]